MREYPIHVSMLIMVGNYYLTTLSLWFGHWVSHLARSPLRNCHVLGHHVLYPNAQNMRSDAFRFSSGKHNSNIALLPPLLLQTVVLYLCIPPWIFFACLFETILVTVLFAYIHIQFHLNASRLEGMKWFRKARARHTIHHDREINFMPADQFWDHVFGTFCRADYSEP